MVFTEKKDEIWLSPMTKTTTPTEKSKKQHDNTKSYKNFDNTMVGVTTRAQRDTDRSPEYNEHFFYKLDSRAKKNDIKSWLQNGTKNN